MSDDLHSRDPETPPPTPAQLVRIEADALHELAQRLEGPQSHVFESLADLLASTIQSGHRIILTGVGKSGLIARKIEATLVSTGSPAQFLHPSEALHGDLGILRHGDVLLVLSYSGETDELRLLLPVMPRLGVTVVSFCGCATSTVALASAHTLDVSVAREACAHQLAPTASTTVMLALGDALALDISRRLQFQAQDFAELHPGGQIGRRLSTVRQLMHSGPALPQVSPHAAIPHIIHEMSSRRLGMTTVIANGRLVGVLSDGDLRRLLERNGPHAFHKTAADIMTRKPRTIGPDAFAADALAVMEQNKITALVVTQDGTADAPVLGVLHLHDLWDVAPQTGRRGADLEAPEPDFDAQVDDDGRL